MKNVQFEIDGKKVSAEEGATILEVARQNDIYIPTLCYNDKINPAGVCRLCLVEISKNGRKKLVASCVYNVEDNLVVKTKTEKITKIRKLIVELLSPSVPALAKELGVEKSRFTSAHTECALCGLCVRYCSDVKKANVVYFRGRGIDRELATVPELANECIYCRECFDLCKGGLIVNQCDRVYQ